MPFPTPCRSPRSGGRSARLRSRRPAQIGGARRRRGTTKPSELREEAGVVGEEEPQVVDAVAGHGQAVDAEAEGEALPLLGVDAAVREHVRVHHPAAAELEERAIGADDVELGRRLREGEVGRAQPRRSEEHTSELQSLMRISYAVFCLKKKKT